MRTRHHLQAAPRRVETYFDRTAADAWEAPDLGRAGRPHPRHRARGRDRMRATLPDVAAAGPARPPRILDAGCGTGALAVEAARAPRWWRSTCRRRWWGWPTSGCTATPGGGRIDFRVGDMLDPALGPLRPRGGDGPLIHYRPTDVVRVLDAFAPRSRQRCCSPSRRAPRRR